MKDDKTVNSEFIQLCQSSKKAILANIKISDVKQLDSLHRFASSPSNINKITLESYKKSREILGKDFYEVYVSNPKVNYLSGILQSDLKSDPELKKTMLAIKKDEQVMIKESSTEFGLDPQKKSTIKTSIDDQFKDKIIEHLEKKYALKISSKDAKFLLSSDFTNRLDKLQVQPRLDRKSKISENIHKKDALKNNALKTSKDQGRKKEL